MHKGGLFTLDRSCTCFHHVYSFYLFGNLAKVADVSQDCAPYEGVLLILPASLGIEVWMECVDTFYSSWTLLPIPKNEVDPQVEVRTHMVTFQGLKQTVEEIVAQTKTS